MTITASIIADSISPQDIRLTTMQLRYPRFIHAEFMTHRVFSRNASSSRAIPVERVIADLKKDPAMPVFWGSNKPGMQAGVELDSVAKRLCETTWLEGRDAAIHYAQELMSLGLHKQIANRILEPWSHINVVVTATEWENFFALRCHKDAQPEIQALADEMKRVMSESVPQRLDPGAWHLPYVSKSEAAAASEQHGIQMSVARCARVSYLTHDGRQSTMEEDLQLYERLVGSVPLHASPAEHQAMPDLLRYGPSFAGARDRVPIGYVNESEHANFKGWRQFRKILEKNQIAVPA